MGLFLVTCAGMSGSKWLAAALDGHPDIRCSHSASLLRQYAEPYSPAQLKEILAAERQQFSGEVPLAEVFARISDGQESRLVGNVHAYRLSRLEEALGSESSTPPFRLANLVRHPVTLVSSRAAFFASMCAGDARVRWMVLDSCYRNQEWLQPLIDRHGLDLSDWDVACYFDAIVGLGRLASEVAAAPHVPHVRMEDLVVDPSAIRGLIAYLSSGRMEISPAVAEDLIAAPPLNSHRGRGPESASRHYQGLPDWQREVLRVGLERSNIHHVYGMLGYDFDFVDV